MAHVACPTWQYEPFGHPHGQGWLMFLPDLRDFLFRASHSGALTPK